MNEKRPLEPDRLLCGDAKRDPDHKHLPATYNPWIDMTACICGIRWWDGATPTVWKSDERFRERADAGGILRGIGMGANGIANRYESLGWDDYELRAT